MSVKFFDMQLVLCFKGFVIVSFKTKKRRGVNYIVCFFSFSMSYVDELIFLMDENNFVKKFYLEEFWVQDMPMVSNLNQQAMTFFKHSPYVFVFLM